MTKAHVTIPIGSARLGSAQLSSARLGSEDSVCFSLHKAFFHKKYIGLLPKTWRVYALASAFCVFREGGGTVLKC